MVTLSKHPSIPKQWSNKISTINATSIPHTITKMAIKSRSYNAHPDPEWNQSDLWLNMHRKGPSNYPQTLQICPPLPYQHLTDNKALTSYTIMRL